MLFVYLRGSAELEAGSVKLGDICDVYAVEESDAHINKLRAGELQQDGTLFFRTVDIARLLKRDDLVFLGAPSCIVSCREKPQSTVVKFLKAGFVFVLLFAGGMTTIMSYHTDVDMLEMSNMMSLLLTGRADTGDMYSVVYALGIAAGVLFFGNLLPSKKQKPTIFQTEQYELESQTQAYLKHEQEGSR